MDRFLSTAEVRRHIILDLLGLCVCLGIAAFALFYQFDTLIPPLPWSDETMIMADAVETLRTGPQLIYPSQLTGGSLAVYLTALHILLFGKGVVALRLLHAGVNLALVAMTYLTVRVFFSDWHVWSARILAVLTCTLLAASLWFLSLGRLAFLNVTLTPLVALGYLDLLWRGLRTGHMRYFLGSGFLMGISAYGYAAAVLMPLALPLFFALEWAISRVVRRESLIVRHGRNLLLLVVAAGVCVLPLTYWFVSDPEVFLHRPLYVGAMEQEDLAAWTLQNGWNILASFGLSPSLLLSGDRTRLVFDPIVAVLFWLGVLIALRYAKQPVYLFLLVWWGVALLPFLFSVQNNIWVFDLMRRGVNAQPVSFTFPALAMMAGTRWLWTRRHLLLRVATPLGAAGIVLFSGMQSFTFYETWIKSPAGQRLFSAQGMELARWLTEHSDPQTVYLLPVRPHTSPTTRPELFSVRTYYEGQSAIAYPELDETSLRAVLKQLTPQRTWLKVLLPEHGELDPKGLLDFLLEQYGMWVGEESAHSFTVRTYRLHSVTEDSGSHATKTTFDVGFGAHLQLVDCVITQPRLPAGQPLWVRATWMVRETTDEEYGSQLALVDENGYGIARTDRMLLDDDLFRTTAHWPPGKSAAAYYRLAIPAETPPGTYRLRMVAYRAGGARLAPARGGEADLALPLAEVEILPAPLPGVAGAPEASYAMDTAVAPGLYLVGAEIPSAHARPGDRLRVTLTWQARAALNENFYLSLGLIQRGGEDIDALTPPRPLVSQRYPTSRWRPGETLRVHYPFLIPASLESGEYVLGLRLLTSPAQRVISEVALQELNVVARPHRFSVPPMEQPLAVRFGDHIRLLGYDRPAVSLADHEVRVRLYWQTSAPLEDSYVIFLHFVDESNRIVAQIDTLPGGGDAPTTGWVVGEVIADDLRIPLPASLPVGRYRLVLGMYHSISGVRLPASGPAGAGDSFVLEEIAIAD